jgi:hypothetical protein
MFELLSCCHVMAVSTGSRTALQQLIKLQKLKSRSCSVCSCYMTARFLHGLDWGKNCCLPVSCHVLVKTYAIVLSVEQQHKSRGLQLVVEFMK